MTTIYELYDPAMKITSAEAARYYFEYLVDRRMDQDKSLTKEEAENIEKTNLGYFAGYYSNEIREQVERLFDCEHPIFGKISEKGPPSSEEAFNMGYRFAKKQEN